MQEPAFTLSGLSALPVMSFNGTSNGFVTSGTFTFSAGATASVVANSTNTGAQQAALTEAGGGFAQQLGYRNSANNQVFVYAGTVKTATATDGPRTRFRAHLVRPVRTPTRTLTA